MKRVIDRVVGEYLEAREIDFLREEIEDRLKEYRNKYDKQVIITQINYSTYEIKIIR